MKGYIVAFLIDCILMFVFAFTLFEWGGIWILEGILSGLGFWLADEIFARKKGDKK